MVELQSFFKLSYGLYVVSSAFEGKQNGCIVNTVTQVTAEPPRATVAIHKDNLTTGLIEKSGFFNAVALTEDAPMELIGRFGFQSGREAEKYADIACEKDANGIFYPTEAAAAVFSFRVVDRMDLGTHLLFLGDTVQAQTLSDAPVMTYAHYHAVKKGRTPPKASSYKPEEKKGWRCRICGYVHEGDELPADFVCPVCKKGAAFFDRL